MRILVTGASGQLGGYVLEQLARTKAQAIAWSGSHAVSIAGTTVTPVNLAHRDQVAQAFREARPTVVLHAAAMASVLECARFPAQAEQVNTQATTWLAELADDAGARLVFVSTDLAFDGERGWYQETDAPRPLSTYGRTKVQAESAVLRLSRGLVVRLSLLYGPTRVGRAAFFDQQLTAWREHRPVSLFHDEWRTPLDLTSAAAALVALARSDYSGILHVGGPERMSRLEMGARLAAYLGVSRDLLVPVSRLSVSASEPRPADTSLDSTRWRRLDSSLPWLTLEQAMQRMGVQR